MRKTLWMCLICLAICSLLASGGLPLLGLEGRSEARSPVGDTRDARAAPELARSPIQSTRPAGSHDSDTALAPEAPGSRPPPARSSADSSLDHASAAEIRRVLTNAIEVARTTGPLYVHPAIIDTVADHGRVRIVFDVDPTSATVDLVRQLRGPGAAALLDDVRFFPLLSHGAGQLGPAALLALVESGTTSSIELDSVHRPSLLDSLPIIGADLAHALDFDGDGTTLAVLDTGIDLPHPFFADRLVEEACFSLVDQCPNGASQMLGPGSAAACSSLGCEHGTHVTAIAVGRDPDGLLVGAAPRAQLIAIQVFSEIDGEIGAFSSDILAALQHVLGLAPFYAIAGVNLSLGGEVHTSEADCDRAAASQRVAVDLLRAAGIATVAASGNEGFTNAMTAPACLSNVIGVGSTDDADRVSAFTNSASFLSTLAPGESIESAALGGGTRFASGTSMATPHVSGAIAAMREAHPTASVGEIENAIGLSGLGVLDPRNGETIPRIDVRAAIDLLGALAAPPPAAAVNGNGAAAATGATNTAGGGACGLVGIEPFLVLAVLRGVRRPRQRPGAQSNASALR